MFHASKTHEKQQLQVFVQTLRPSSCQVKKSMKKYYYYYIYRLYIDISNHLIYVYQIIWYMIYMAKKAVLCLDTVPRLLLTECHECECVQKAEMQPVTYGSSPRRSIHPLRPAIEKPHLLLWSCLWRNPIVHGFDLWKGRHTPENPSSSEIRWVQNQFDYPNPWCAYQLMLRRHLTSDK